VSSRVPPVPPVSSCTQFCAPSCPLVSSGVLLVPRMRDTAVTRLRHRPGVCRWREWSREALTATQSEAPNRGAATDCSWRTVFTPDLQSFGSVHSASPVALVTAGIRIAEPSQRVDPSSGSGHPHRRGRHGVSACDHSNAKVALGQARIRDFLRSEIIRLPRLRSREPTANANAPPGIMGRGRDRVEITRLEGEAAPA